MTKRRGLQKRTAETLKPLGFKEISATTFARQIGGQLHFVGLQYGGFSKGFTFNLGCHFDGLPSMFDFETVAVDELEDLDCGLRIRVGAYIGEGVDTWWTPDNSELTASLAQASWAIERAFNDCLKKWGSDGARIVQSHTKASSGSIKLSRPLFRWMWPCRNSDRYAFVALLAYRHGNIQLAKALYEKGVSFEDVVPISDPKLRAALDMPPRNDSLQKVKNRRAKKSES